MLAYLTKKKKKKELTLKILCIFDRLLLGFFCACKFYNELMSLTKGNRIRLPMLGRLDTQIKLQRMMWVSVRQYFTTD